jgi:hypothetical protein
LIVDLLKAPLRVRAEFVQRLDDKGTKRKGKKNSNGGSRGKGGNGNDNREGNEFVQLLQCQRR